MKKWVLQIFECAFLRRRRMAHNGAIFGRCFSEFFRKWSSSAVFPHAVSQVRGQLPHKSGDKPLPCHKKAVILHRNSKSSHVHRTLIALPSHTRTSAAAERRSSSASRVLNINKIPKIKQDFLILDNEKFWEILRNFVLFKITRLFKIKQDFLILDNEKFW